MIFAKLFCYLALIRSNRVHGTYTSGGNSTYNSINGSTNSSSTYLVVELLSRLLTLYNMKGWLQEIVTEAILLLLDRLYIHNNSSNSSKSEDVDEEIVQLLSPIVSAPLEDFSASQVMFAIGLQHIVSASAKHANRNSCNEISYKKVKKQKKNSVNSSNSSINGSADHSADSSTNSSTAHCLLRLVPQEKHVQIEYLSRIESTLLAATAGFPKVTITICVTITIAICVTITICVTCPISNCYSYYLSVTLTVRIDNALLYYFIDTSSVVLRD